MGAALQLFMPQGADDNAFMRAALVEAQKGVGHTSPNPAVGAVLVADGKIVASGHHRRAGNAHAEVNCIATLSGPVPKQATLYVTLEPCSTTGLTPPCTDAIIAAGIRTVVIGATDPNPVHSGRGIELLQNAGVTVRVGVLATECLALNRAFNKWIRTRRPYVIAKCGMSLDGRLTQPPDAPRWITSATARRHANHRRALVDAILIGAETVRADNPRLTVRGIAGARQPWRVVLSRSGSLPREAHLFTDRYADRTLVFPEGSLESVLTELGRREITSVLVEGGGEVLSRALDERQIDCVELYFGSVFTGGPTIAFAGKGAASSAEALRLSHVRYEQVGGDVFMTGEVVSAEGE